jgi:hypothetical protein
MRVNFPPERNRMIRSPRLPLVFSAILMLLLAACGGGTSSSSAASSASTNDQASATESATDAAPDDGNGGAAGDPTASVNMTVTGGEFAGSYSGSVADGGCSRNLTGDNTFGVQYSTDQKVKLSSVQVLVYDAKAAASGTDAFKSSFTFGDLFSGTGVDIDPSTNAGTGTVTVDDRGDSATVKISGETGDGDKIDATVECNGVISLGG